MTNSRAHLAARAAAALPARRMSMVHVAMASQHQEDQHIHKHSKHRQQKHGCDSIVNDSALLRLMQSPLASSTPASLSRPTVVQAARGLTVLKSRRTAPIQE